VTGRVSSAEVAISRGLPTVSHLPAQMQTLPPFSVNTRILGQPTIAFDTPNPRTKTVVFLTSSQFPQAGGRQSGAADYTGFESGAELKRREAKRGGWGSPDGSLRREADRSPTPNRGGGGCGGTGGYIGRSRGEVFVLQELK
jgi:hypothetical protein